MLLIGLILLIVLLALGVPVVWTFLGVAVFLVLSLGYDPNFLLPYGFSQLNSTLLLAIPMFIIAGKLIEKGGVGDVIVKWAEVLLGRITGGLGVASVFACAIFGSISGSALAALSTIGSIMFGKLDRAGYPRGFAAALLANASILGLLIPPSGIMILYAWLANVSVLAAFLSTLLPGIILMVLLSGVTLVYMRAESRRKVKVGGQRDVLLDPLPAKQLARTFGKRTVTGIPALLLPVIILGGIYSGVLTTVEAAVVAAIYTIPLGLWVYRQLKVRDLKDVLVEGAATTGVVMIMAYSMMVLSRIFTMERLPDAISSVLLSISEQPVIILLMINLLIIILGMLIDDVSGVLLVTPILLPVAIGIGVDPIHFAAIVGVNLGMANITPPTAPLLYFGSQLGRAPINEMMKPTLLMIAVGWIPALGLTTFVPELSLWLPELILGYTPQ